MLRNWSLLNKPEVTVKLEGWANELERRSMLPPRLTWEGAAPCYPGSSRVPSRDCSGMLSSGNVIRSSAATVGEPGV